MCCFGALIKDPGALQRRFLLYLMLDSLLLMNTSVDVDFCYICIMLVGALTLGLDGSVSHVRSVQPGVKGHVRACEGQ